MGEDKYDLNAIDSKTKFVLAHLFVDKRTKEECIKFLKQIKDSCYEQMLEIYKKEKNKKIRDRKLIEFTCDKFANYKTAFMKLFNRVCKLNFGISIAYQKHGVKHNNNPIERYNGKTKDRIISIRSSFKSFDSARCFMDLRRTIYNFVNPHQELKGKTPAEAAEIILPLKRNKLLGLIKYWARHN